MNSSKITKELGEYKGLTKLTSSLVHMKVNTLYKVEFRNNISIILKYEKDKKYYITLNVINNSLFPLLKKNKIKLEYNRIRTKVLFLSTLKKIIDKTLPILQKEGYKNIDEVQSISLFDLENIEQDFNLKIDKTIKLKGLEKEKQESKILNTILINHNILQKNKDGDPYKEGNKNYIININSLDLNHIILFPSENKNYENIKLKLVGTPNLYFPGILNISIRKEFSFKGYYFIIKYEGTNIVKHYASIVKQYYEYYKLKVNSLKKEESNEILNFSTKLFSILKNPYNKEFLKENSKKDLILKSNCQKCGSASSMFNVTFSNVNIKNEMSSMSSNELYPENILDYKDILSIKCLECGNPIFEDKNKIIKIEDKRNYLDKEDWRNPIDGIPLLDNPEVTNVIIKYDCLEMQTEFDLTNPLNPQLDYNKIIKTGKVIGWLHTDTNTYTNFYHK